MDSNLTCVKLSCSLKWLAGVLSESLEMQSMNRQALWSMLLEPYQDGILKNSLILSLTNTSLYSSAIRVLFPGDRVPQQGTSFEPLIHSLAKKGGYVLESDGTIVTGSMLAQEAPFREKSHLAFLDALMFQYASKLVTVHRIVKAVRTISTFNASKELPCKIELDLLLIMWLNKVSGSVQAKRSEEVNRLIHDPDPRQRRRNKTAITQFGDHIVIPMIKAGDLCSGIYDGKTLAALLLHYAPQDCTWNDFNINGHALSQKKILENLKFVHNYCSTHLPAPGFHLDPNQLIDWGQSGLLNTNILVLLAHLFHCFEVKGQKNASVTCAASNSASVSVSHQQSRSSLQCSITGAISKPVTDSLRKPLSHGLRNSLQSQSAEAFLAAEVSSRNSLIYEQSDGDSTVKATSQSSLDSNSRTFKAPLRTSLNVFQSKALTAFSKEQHSLMKGALSQSSPLLSVQAAPMPHALVPLAKSQLISASSDNLNIQQQVRDVRTRKREVSHSHLRNPLGLSHSRSKPGGTMQIDSTDGAQFDEHAWIVSDQHTGATSDQQAEIISDQQAGGTSDQQAEIISDQQAGIVSDQQTGVIPDGGDENKPGSISDAVVDSSDTLPIAQKMKSPASQVRGSFTLNKQHTYASASAAGLPIINDNDKPSSANVDEKPSMSDPCMSKMQPNSGNMKANNETIMLTNLLHGGLTYTISSHDQEQPIPANVKKLRENLRSFITGLQSDSVHMERESMIQRLKLYHPGKGKNNADPDLLISEATPSESVPIMNDAGKTTDVDLKASVSLPTLHCNPSPAETAHLHRGTTASLEQFERDEFLIQLHTSSEKTLSCPVVHQSQEDISEGIYHPLENLPLSPIASNGQVFIEQTPPLSENVPIAGATSMQPIRRATEDAPIVGVTSVDPITENIPVSVSSNPWLRPINQDTLMQSTQKRDHHIKRIKDRDHARKVAAEQRAEQRKRQDLDQQRKEKRQKDVVRSHTAHGLDDVPTSSPAVNVKADTIHFQLSSHALGPAETVPISDQQMGWQDPAVVQTTGMEASASATVHVYSGPECYVKPKAKSNLKIVRNAICAVCLAGEVNLSMKQKILYELENTSATHVLILFRDTIGFKFRGIYSYNQGDRFALRIHGTSPRELKEYMISHIYKYNSGQKEFKEIPSRSLSVSVDGLTIKSEYWHTAKRKTVKAIL